MKVLRQIGAFFSKIWRWIKETAWVQPLLIVGAIFLVIFGIPSFSKWVSGLGVSGEDYYTHLKLTLNNEAIHVAEYDPNNGSDADKITDSMEANSNFDDKEDFTLSEEDASKYGYKFFLVYVKDDCSGCKEIQSAFKVLQEDWNNKYKPIPSTFGGKDVATPFKVHTIFTDEESATDEDDTNVSETAFQRYLQIHSDFFESAGTRLKEQTPYKINASVGDTNYDYLINTDLENFQTPTILLVDYTDEALRLNRIGSTIKGRRGVSEVLFGVDGSTKFDKAQTLLNMWNHTDGLYEGDKDPDNDWGSSSPTAKNNPFANAYVK